MQTATRTNIHAPGATRAQRLAVCKGTRRDVLLGGAALAAPLIIIKDAKAEKLITRYIEVDTLSTFQKAGQRQEFRLRAESVLKGILTADDAPAAVRLVLHDAGTYDLATKKGGFDASIILNSDEAARPENADLKDIIAKVKEAKAKIDAGDKEGAGPISYADTMYLAGKVATQKKWYTIKIGSAKTVSGGKIIAEQFPNPWQVELGRVDSSEAGPNRVPALDADVATIKAFLLQLGAKPGAAPGPFTAKPPFWERPGYLLWTATAPNQEAEEERLAKADPAAYESIKKGYDVSKRSTTRTDYEVDFSEVYNKLARQGATFNPKAYLYRVPFASIV